ncbi:MAG: gamma-glutamyltransferase, partial [Paracoccaceae bacterium]|nr:gamma-glutamyltransferase [Paracoccaceae bacterium]
MSGALTTPHPLATAAGMAVLRAGGTAPEALIAAGAALCVVMPHFCGLGGDAVWMLADRNGQQRCDLAIGQGIDRPMPRGPIPTRGPGSVLTTAALVSGWQNAFDRAHSDLGGQARWEDLLAPAIALAEDGFAVSPSQAFWGAFRKAECRDWPGFAGLYTSGGAPLAAGQMLRQPQLARSLRRIAQQGADAFYTGDLSRDILAGLRAAGVVIGAADLAATRTRSQHPMAMPYRDLTLLA